MKISFSSKLSNQNCISNYFQTNGFDTAPFLPPPPSKTGRRAGGDDRYAALETLHQPTQQNQNQLNNLGNY